MINETNQYGLMDVTHIPRNQNTNLKPLMLHSSQ